MKYLLILAFLLSSVPAMAQSRWFQHSTSQTQVLPARATSSQFLKQQQTDMASARTACNQAKLAAKTPADVTVVLANCRKQYMAIQTRGISASILTPSAQ